MDRYVITASSKEIYVLERTASELCPTRHSGCDLSRQSGRHALHGSLIGSNLRRPGRIIHGVRYFYHTGLKAISALATDCTLYAKSSSSTRHSWCHFGSVLVRQNSITQKIQHNKTKQLSIINPTSDDADSVASYD